MDSIEFTKPLVINQRGEPKLVLMSWEDYEALASFRGKELVERLAKNLTLDDLPIS